MKTLREYLVESILDPLQEKLSPELWDDNGKLKKSVKAYLVKSVENFAKANTPKKIDHLFLLGSMTGYQYNDTSDVDINIVMNFGDSRIAELGKVLMDTMNEKPLPGTKHPVNYYITNKVKSSWKKFGAVYDILKDTWIKKADKEKENTLAINYRAVIEIARFFISGLDAMISEYTTDAAAYNSYFEYLKASKTPEDKEDVKRLISFKLQEVIADIDSLEIAKHLIKGFRGEAFEEVENETEIGFKISTKIIINDTANNSINNLVYKYLEKFGYFKKIKDITDTRESWEAKVVA